MAKKDFNAINTGRVYSTIEKQTAAPAEKPAKEENTMTIAPPVKTEQNFTEYTDLASPGRSDRKGKNVSFSVGLTAENYDYVKTMARVSGRSMAQFLNYVLEQSREGNKELYEKIKEFTNSL